MQFKPGDKVYHKTTNKKVWTVVKDEGSTKVIIKDEDGYTTEVLRENLSKVEEKGLGGNDC